MSSRVDRMAVLGDVGGQAGAFRHQLTMLGMDPLEPAVPPGMMLVQVGDLVSMTGSTTHSNRETVDLAARLLALNPGRYIQLLGNHELGALGGAVRPGWTGEADPAVEALLGSMSFRSALGVIRPGCPPLLLTHAGVTLGRWNSLGRPGPRELVANLNERMSSGLQTSRRPGRLVTGVTDVSADEQWAEVNFELYEPWLGADAMPWVQVHGHASPWSWTLGGWWPDTPAGIREITVLEPESRISRTASGMVRFVSVNWELTDRDSNADGAPLVIRLSPQDTILL